MIGAGLVGVMAYQAWYRGQTLEEVASDIDTKVRSFLDDVISKLPALPPIPTIQFPDFSQMQYYSPPPPPPQPQQQQQPPTNESGAPATQQETGQLSTNPNVSNPPEGSGPLGNAAIVAIAGDFASGGAAKATGQSMQKHKVQFIAGTGDYGFGMEPTKWIQDILGQQFVGKIKGALGNHDGNEYLQAFGQDSWNTWIKVAPTLAFVFMKEGIGEAELDSLTSKAKASGVKHIIYVLHIPYVTGDDAHHKASENKNGPTIDKVAKKYGVQIIAAGHNHNYEHFLRNGIHYITVGAGGRPFYTSSKGAGMVKIVNNKNGFVKVSIGQELLLQFIDNNGVIHDSFKVSGSAIPPTMQLAAAYRRVSRPYKYYY